MTKEFNITGNCRSAKHYMADVSKKLVETINMVERGKYFIINRPRQYGKTTLLYTIADKLIASKDYVVFNISFEGIGNAIFDDEKVFAQGFVDILSDFAYESAPELEDWMKSIMTEINNLKDLSKFITQLVKKAHKQLIIATFIYFVNQ